MRSKIFNILLLLIIVCSSCEFKLKPNENDEDASRIHIERYDRLESRYLTTGDFSALQQMNMEYPIETRTLVEKMLRIGDVSDHDISERFLRFFQDSTLQELISDVESEYANMDDLNQQFERAFENLQDVVPSVPIPHIYSQISALDQSIVVGEKMIGISLDKYMGAKYPLYQRFDYSNEQLETMGRNSIVPDALNFYLLSLYPMKNYDSRTQLEKDLHMGKVMWVVNKVLATRFYNTDYIQMVDKYMRHHPKVSVEQLLNSDDYSALQ